MVTIQSISRCVQHLVIGEFGGHLASILKKQLSITLHLIVPPLSIILWNMNVCSNTLSPVFQEYSPLPYRLPSWK